MGRIFAALLLAGSLVAPPGSAAPAGTPGRAIAVQWRSGGPASDPPSASQRLVLREAVAAGEGQPVELIDEDAHGQARLVAAHELPISIRERAVELRATLDRADAAYRAGDFEFARSEADAALERLQANPQLSGAVASAREAYLLLAKVAWAAGEGELAERALRDALRIDPTATLSARAAAPALVERYVAVQTGLLGERDQWREPNIELPGDVDAGDIEVEIDGLPGPRNVPPGPHFVVVRRRGHVPVAAWHERDTAWTVPVMTERVSPELPAALELICEVLALDVLVLAERRGQRLGVQAHRCGQGNGPLWVGDAEVLAEGVARGLADAPLEPGPPALFGAWPERIAVDLGLIEAPPPPPRPWYRKGWIWGTSVGAAVAISGAVAAGVLLGGRSPRISVDATPFIGSQ